jgi:hypothetical protein
MNDRPKINPQRVGLALFPEDAAFCFQFGFKPEDVVFTPDSEPPYANALYQRKKGKLRYWFYHEVEGGKSTHLTTGAVIDDPDRAVAWVMTRYAEKRDRAGMRIIPELIQLCDVYAKYKEATDKRQEHGEICLVTKRSICCRLAIAGKAHRGLTIADLQRHGGSLILDWCKAMGYAHNTAVKANKVAKAAINAVLASRGSTLRLTFYSGKSQPAVKEPLDPDEEARILRHLETGVIFGPDNRPLMVPDPITGERVEQRCGGRQMLANIPFRMALPLMVDSGTRKGASLEVSLIPGEGAFIDLDAGILYRRGEMTQDRPIKRRPACVLSQEYLHFLRPIAEDCLARGITHLIHDKYGNPAKKLDYTQWKRILKSANVKYRRLHCLKDTAVQISRLEGVPLAVAAERFGNDPQTLTRHYGSDWDLGNQIDAAEAQGRRERWVARHEGAKARRNVAQAARENRAEPKRLPQSRPRPGGPKQRHNNALRVLSPLAPPRKTSARPKTSVEPKTRNT